MSANKFHQVASELLVYTRFHVFTIVGHVTTYKHIANALEKPSAFRAVGNALRRNPFAPIVPCHRVIASDRSLGGFYGATQGVNIDRKIKMLKDESVIFDSDGRVNEKCIFDPAQKPQSKTK